jgi:hypothetical protein
VPYVRTVKTASGATAVQIVYSSHRGSRDIEHIGSAHDEAGLELLKAAARQRLAAGQGELDLGLGTGAAGTSPRPADGEMVPGTGGHGAGRGGWFFNHLAWAGTLSQGAMPGQSGRLGAARPPARVWPPWLPAQARTPVKEPPTAHVTTRPPAPRKGHSAIHRNSVTAN